MAINPKPSFPKIVDRSIRRKGARVPSNVFPASPIEGDLFYHTTTDTLWVYNGNDWVQLTASGAWTDYTPASTNITVGNGTQVARWTRMGRTVHVHWSLTFGSTTSITVPQVGLPVATVVDGLSSLGAAYFIGSTQNVGIARPQGATQVRMSTSTNSGTGVGGTVTDTSPFTWTTGNKMSFTITYEAAASV